MESFIKAFVAYFVLIDPVGNALVFNALTAGKDPAYSRRMAGRSVLISMMLVLFFGFWGEAILYYLGIQMESLRILSPMNLLIPLF